MTGICAYVGKDETEAVSRVKTMLDAMSVRGTISETTVGKTQDGVAAIGRCWYPDSEGREPRKAEGTRYVLDGSLFLEHPHVFPNNLDLMSASNLLKTPGAFSFLGFKAEDLTACRDPLGQKPLYWGMDTNGNCGMATLKIGLSAVGIVDQKPVVPGQFVSISKTGPAVRLDAGLMRPEHLEISEERAVEQLEDLLLESVRVMIPERSALSFSGGLDSSLVAMACQKLGLKPELITVGLQGQAELEHAAQAATLIGLHHNLQRLSEDLVTGSIPDVVRLTESDSPVIVGTSIPFRFVCQVAVENGLHTIVAGQLSDELFGGYARFERAALMGGLGRADSAMWDSVLAAAGADFEPGDKVAASLGLELRCPFAYLPLVQTALKLPVELRLKVDDGRVTRKYILRRLAEKWGLPPSIVNKPKKAFQYSSGVQKVLTKEARGHHRALGELLTSHLKTLQGPRHSLEPA